MRRTLACAAAGALAGAGIVLTLALAEAGDATVASPEATEAVAEPSVTQDPVTDDPTQVPEPTQEPATGAVMTEPTPVVTDDPVTEDPAVAVTPDPSWEGADPASRDVRLPRCPTEDSGLYADCVWVSADGDVYVALPGSDGSRIFYWMD